jgi:amino acid adenylation domain-containing protein
MADRDVEARRALLSDSKRRLLEARLRGEGLGQRMRPAQGDGPVELSPAERRLWFLGQLDPHSTAYAMVKAVRLSGSLDIAALDGALHDLVLRHSTLRREIRSVRGHPEARLRPPPARMLGHVDLSGLEDAAQDDAVQQVIGGIAARPFALENGDVLRATLIRLRPGRHVLGLVMHHIAADGWSVGLLFRDLCRCYDARLGGPPTGPPPRPYDEVARERTLSDARRQSLVAHWKARLAGLPVLELPRPSPGAQASAGRLARDLPPPLVGRLGQLCQARGVTPFMALLATSAAVLARFTGQTDLVIGTPVSGRDDPDAAEVVGLFINMLPLRLTFAKVTPFEVLLDRARRVTVEALDHQDLPFDELVRVLDLPRVAGRSPVFQALYVHQVAPRFDETMRGLRMTGLDVAPARPAYDLTISSVERPEGLRLVAEFDPAKLGAATAAAMLEAVEVLLAGWTRDPSAPVGRLPVAAAADPAMAGPEAAPASEPLHRRMSDRAALWHDRIAIEDQAGQTSHAALIRRRSEIAAGLHSAGIGPGALVGLALPRDAGMVAAILAVDLLGAAFVPLQPGQAPGRVAGLFGHRGPDLVLVGPGETPGLPERWPRRTLAELEAQAGPAPEPAPFEPEDLAYVMPTSGSAGRPKAVACTRGGLVSRLDAMAAALPLRDGDVVLAGTGLSFDIALLELLLPLRLGLKVALAPDGEPLVHTARNSAASVIQATPSGWRSLIESGDVGPACRLALVGGETLTARLAGDLRRGGREVWNLYGPTEATIWCAATPVTDADSPPIGGPLPGVRLAVLDRRMQPVPVGVTGSLHVAGTGIARGYLGAPAATALAFRPDPDAPRPGGRLYRTGDSVRRRGDGSLDFLGREDRQAKIRGHRVDLHEVEAALSGLPEVAEAAAVARDDPRTDSRRLVAYVRLAPGSVPDPACWRRELARNLPPAMIPSLFVPMAAMPRTSNGKLDRAALPPPGRAPLAPAAVAGPADAGERRFYALVGRLLDAPRAGPSDNFFDLGGDSMRAVELVALAAEEGQRLEVRDVFDRSTLRDLFAAAGPTEGTDPAPGPFDLVSHRDRRRLPGGLEAVFPMSRMQTGIAIAALRHPGRYHAVVSLELALDLEPEAIRDNLAALIAADPALRTRFAPTGFEEPLQLVATHAEAIVEAVDLSALSPEAQEQTRDRAMAEDRGRPLPLDRAPMLHVRVTRLAPGRTELTLVCHHAMFDGWSRALLLTSLIRGVPAEARRDPALARRFVSAERDSLADPAARGHWAERLKDAPAAAPAPPAPRLLRAVALRGDLVAALHRRVQVTGFPLRTLLLGAHLLACGRLAETRHAMSGVIVNARPAVPGAEDGLGLFVNTLPVCVDTGLAGPAFLGAVHAAEAGLVAHRAFPLDELRRMTGRADLADTVFNLTAFTPYRALDRSVLLGARTHETTGIGFAANFGLDPEGATLELTLEASQAGRDRAWLDRAAGTYTDCLREIAQAGGAGAAPTLAAAPVAAAILRNAEAHPDHIAVADDQGALSYRTLADTVRALMAGLREKACAEGAVVGVSATRSLAQPAALLAVLGLGAAYAPLDPGDPDERLAGRIRETGVRLVLAPAAESPRFAQFGLTTIATDRRLPQGRADPVEADPDLPAYVIHTSGSTGRPKGVVIPRRALDLYAVSAARRFGLGASDRVLQFASLTFDAAVEEIFPTLLAGATLLLRSVPAATSVPGFLGFLTRHEVSVANLPTGFWHGLTDAMARLGTSAPAGLRLVVIGGEAARAGSLAQWQVATAGRVVLENSYGPTEATVVAIAGQPGAVEPGWGDAVPLGGPVADTGLVVVDRTGRPVAAGETGTIVLHGSRLARGYLRRPAETAARFLPEPWSGRPGSRCYTTGDRAVTDASGRLFFAGRSDRQIKLRGYRIELDEIEAVLAGDPGVSGAVVEWIGLEGADPVIAAAVVARDPEADEAATFDALGTRLRARLRDEMMPTRMRLLSCLPQAASGKVDRVAVRAALGHVAPAAGDPPRPGTELILAGIWTGLLGRISIDRRTDFFAAGGHSLLALQLLTRIEEAFGAAPPVAAVFEASRLGHMAARIDACLAVPAPRGRSRIALAPPGRTAPLSIEQTDLWRQNRLGLRYGFFNMPVAVRVEGPLDTGALAEALGGIVRRHEILRTVFPPGAGAGEQLVAPTDAFDLDRIDLAESDLGTVRAYLAEEARLPFDLERELPFRATLLALGAEDHVLALTLHHIAGDAWSLRLLFAELSAAMTRGTAPPVPLRQYRDYALWQRRTLAEGGFDAEIGYWSRRLEGLSPLPPMLPALDAEPGGLYGAVKAGMTADGASRLAARGGATPFMVVLAALAVLDRVWYGSTDFRVATMVANRNERATEEMIGLFANTLIMRADTSRASSFDQLLATVRDCVVEAFAHRGVPFETVSERLWADKPPAGAVRVMVLMNAEAGAALDLGAGQVAAADAGAPAETSPRPMFSGFDLVLTVTDRGGRFDLDLRYGVDRVDGADARRLLDALAAVIGAASARPDLDLAALGRVAGDQ